ncbi:hypothetical protein [Haloplanus aerogenes]|uniref:Uncharacterized protein n=1 Tax=Haloplanus aerogenes TaxID=660522 RepID=A0A3M0DY48_9EURY|nr:hypothetical protein [Haloplanus aerogenes]AZH25893.1 hypothetical protein DU502_11120 [Haloplanus aerogenes]RMB25647.1 hypothetical protein ATH50_0744 [Haloplanus aerogenes]
MAETESLKRSAGYGVRWVWFILVGFFWRIVITLSIILVALALFAPVAMIAGGAGAVAGDTASFVVGVVALLAWPVCLGAIGDKTGIGYPRLSVDLSFHSPEEDDGLDGPSDTDTISPTTPTDAENEI